MVNMPTTKTQSGKRMWPFSEMSLDSASLWGDIANLTLLCSLVVGVISTFVIVRTENVKEHHWDIDRQHSSERIAELDNETVKLRKQLQPRKINGEEFLKSLEGKPKAPVEIVFSPR